MERDSQIQAAIDGYEARMGGKKEGSESFLQAVVLTLRQNLHFLRGGEHRAPAKPQIRPDVPEGGVQVIDKREHPTSGVTHGAPTFRGSGGDSEGSATTHGL